VTTWIAAIVETRDLPDFWATASRHGVVPLSQGVPKHVLIDCGAGFDFHAPVQLAEALSRDTGGMAIGFLVQTNADVHELHAYQAGALVRRLQYSRDYGGWQAPEGSTQAWERAYFFDDQRTTDGQWPSLLDDEATDDDVARYEAAKRDGDASPILDLIRPSSTIPMRRVCAFFGLTPEEPAARWKKPSFWSGLFSRK
jgi:hypothetical protein